MTETHVNSVGEYIARRRKALHITQVDLMNRLAKLGVERKPSTIANWETGQSPVPQELIPALARALEEPSPTTLYELAGVIDQLPGGQIVKLLKGQTPEFIERVERMIDAFLRSNE